MSIFTSTKTLAAVCAGLLLLAGVAIGFMWRSPGNDSSAEKSPPPTAAGALETAAISDRMVRVEEQLQRLGDSLGRIENRPTNGGPDPDRAVDDRMTQMELRVAILQDYIEALTDQQTLTSDIISEIAPSDKPARARLDRASRRDPEARAKRREELAAKAAENRRNFVDRFNEEAVDPSWSTAAAGNIQESLSSLGTRSGSQVSSIDCREKTCRVTADHPSRKDMTSFLLGFSGKATREMPNVRIFNSRNSDGSIASTVYLSRRSSE